MFDLISSAHAAQSGAVSQGNSSLSLIMIGGIFALTYFMLIRPQQKREKERRALIEGVKKGDEVITSGGILAKVVNIKEQYLKVSPAEGMEFNIQRSSVSAILPKGTLKSL